MFSSRSDAGKKLGDELKRRNVNVDLVLGIARGGVVVAKEISKIIKVPYNVIVTKKIPAPQQSELAIGAIALGGVVHIENGIVDSLTVGKEYIQEEIRNQNIELISRENKFRLFASELRLKNKRIVLTDDGMATGASVKVAIKWLRIQQVAEIILALPVAESGIARTLYNLVDECVILEEAKYFRSVGEFYKDFRQVSEEEVIKLLASSESASSI